jgi:hypothetical protein
VNVAWAKKTEESCLLLKGSRRLKYFCAECEQGLSVIPKLLKKVSALKTRVSTLEAGLNELKYKHSSPAMDTIDK